MVVVVVVEGHSLYSLVCHELQEIHDGSHAQLHDHGPVRNLVSELSDASKAMVSCQRRVSD